MILLAVALAASLSAPGCATDRPAANKETVRRMVAAINARDFDALDDVVAADVHRHCAATPDATVENREQFKQLLRHDLASFPDARQNIGLMLAEGDLVALRAVYSGTQDGPMGPYPPTHRRVEIPFLGILRVEQGKVAEIWVEWDNLGPLIRLGHLSPPGQA